MSIFDTEPDLVIADEDAVVNMEAWGLVDLGQGSIHTVSKALHQALQAAFGRAATKGIDIDTIREEHPDAELDDELTALVPPWATLGILLAYLVLTYGAEDTAQEGEPDGLLWATPPIKALGDRPVWIQRSGPGSLAAFFPEDY